MAVAVIETLRHESAARVLHGDALARLRIVLHRLDIGAIGPRVEIMQPEVGRRFQSDGCHLPIAIYYLPLAPRRCNSASAAIGSPHDNASAPSSITRAKSGSN